MTVCVINIAMCFGTNGDETDTTNVLKTCDLPNDESKINGRLISTTTIPLESIDYSYSLSIYEYLEDKTNDGTLYLKLVDNWSLLEYYNISSVINQRKMFELYSTQEIIHLFKSDGVETTIAKQINNVISLSIEFNLLPTQLKRSLHFTFNLIRYNCNKLIDIVSQLAMKIENQNEMINQLSSQLNTMNTMNNKINTQTNNKIDENKKEILNKQTVLEKQLTNKYNKELDNVKKTHSKEIKQMKDDLTKLKKELSNQKNEFNKQLKTYSTRKENKNEIDKINKQLSIKTNKNELNGLILTEIKKNKQKYITKCRICFKETEGSSQCQGNRNSCSAWSNIKNGEWTKPFRDDTDRRPGGCKYQWRSECV